MVTVFLVDAVTGAGMNPIVSFPVLRLGANPSPHPGQTRGESESENNRKGCHGHEYNTAAQVTYSALAHCAVMCVRSHFVDARLQQRMYNSKV